MLLETSKLKANRRITGIPPIIQLATTLNVLASGSYQINVGSHKALSIAQTTVSKIFRNTLKTLEERICPHWIFLDENAFPETQNYFFEKFKLPGIVGIVDGTHIPILKPNVDEHVFFNRKGYHSLNVMVVSLNLNLFLLF